VLTTANALGGHLALNVALSPPPGVELRGVVDFSGPTVTAPLPDKWSTLPPVLIVHGTEDRLGFPKESEYAVAQVAACGKVKGRDYLFEPYQGQGQGFKEPALTQARNSTVAFFANVL
jgi:dienelactone hydrolase